MEKTDRIRTLAREKLDHINRQAGRAYGEDGYGDEYLELLAEEIRRELAFSEFTLFLAEKMDLRP